MANPTPSPSTQKQESGSTYCSDPECQSCQDLRAMLEVVRVVNNPKGIIEVLP